MNTGLTVVFEINFTVQALNKLAPWDKPQKTAFPKLQEIVNKRVGQSDHCKEGYRYTVVLDLPHDNGILGALIYWSDYGNFSYSVRWFREMTCMAQGV